MAEQAAPAAPAPAAPAADKPKGGMMGPLAAGVVLIAIGAGVGWFVASTLSTVKSEGVAEAEAHAEDGKKKHDDGHVSIEHLTEVAMPDLISNVRNQAGRRYIKLTCSFWLSNDDAAKVGFAGGGGHGGGTGGADVKRIVQMALEEHLRSYDIDELTGPNIALQLKKGFKDRIEKTLRELFPDLKADQELVHRVVLTNLLVQ